MPTLKTGVMQPPAEESWQAPDTGRGKGPILPEFLKGSGPCQHLGFD